MWLLYCAVQHRRRSIGMLLQALLHLICGSMTTPETIWTRSTLPWYDSHCIWRTICTVNCRLFTKRTITCMSSPYQHLKIVFIGYSYPSHLFRTHFHSLFIPLLIPLYLSFFLLLLLSLLHPLFLPLFLPLLHPLYLSLFLSLSFFTVDHPPGSLPTPGPRTGPSPPPQGQHAVLVSRIPHLFRR